MGMFSRGLGFLLPFLEQNVELSDSMPPPEATTPTPGSAARASRDDHQHPRLTSSHGSLVTDGGGSCVVVFTRTFAADPSIVITGKTVAGNMPALFDYTLTYANGLVTGCVVKAYKGQAVTVALLGVNVNAFGGNAAGLGFSLTAVQAS